MRSIIKIYYADISGLEDSCISGFSRYRMDKLSSLHNPTGRKQAIGAELLLLKALKDNYPALPLPPHIETNEWGKPFINYPGLHIGISHSGSISACAAGDSPLGLDVQKLSKYSPALIRREFSPSEQQYIMSSPEPDSAFTRIWAMKESVLKADGAGLRASMASFSVYPERTVLLNKRSYSVWDKFTEGCFFALCAEDGAQLKPELIKITF